MEHPYGWLSLLPPLVAIVLAIVTRRVIVSLLAGVFVGALITCRGNPFTAVADTLEVHLWTTLTDPGRLRVFSFTLLMGACVGVINRSAGMSGLVNVMSPWANTRRRGQLITWLLGLLIFFDDYANTLLLGNTLRPLCDRLRISREKLAYLVDSTAAPVAGLALVSTWVAIEIALVRDGLNNLPADVALSAFDLFIASIPYRFYILLALVFVLLTALLGRDFGPMLTAERRRLREPLGVWQRDEPMSHYPTEPDPATPARWYNAVVPIGVVLAVVVVLIYTTGLNNYRATQTEGAESAFDSVTAAQPPLRDIFGEADSSLALQYGALAGLVVIALLAWVQRLLDGRTIVAAAGAGARVMLPAVAILWLASTMSEMTGNKSVDGRQQVEGDFPNQDYRLYTGHYLTNVLTGSESPQSARNDNPAADQPAADQPIDDTSGDAAHTDAQADAPPATARPTARNRRMIAWLPTIVFVLASIISFATGTSWGTMGIMMPMVIPLAYGLLNSAGAAISAENPILLGAIGGVLAGSIFGDHCSPISDTTILSSQSSGCDHVAHVWTQMPYALLVALVAIVFGTLPIGYGVSVWIVLPLSTAALVVLLYILGKPVEIDDNQNEVRAATVDGDDKA